MKKFRNPNIWYLLPEMKLGGAEKHVIRLASGLRQRGYAAGIACIFREGILAQEVRQAGIPFAFLDAPYRWNVATMMRIFRWVRRSPVDILHTYLFGFHFFAGLPARLAAVPVVIASRREIALWQKTRHRWLENLGNGFCDRVICCSDAVRQWMHSRETIAKDKVLTIYNGVDPESFPGGDPGMQLRQLFGIPEAAFLIGTVANFAPEKGYPYLLHAASEVLEKYPETWFVFIGSGPLEEEIKERAGKLKAGRRIIFTGFRSDIAELLKAMDLFVLASVMEGFPNVLLEAMAAGKPVVATQTGGIPELIEPGTDGLLVPPKDGAALAGAMMAFIGDAAWRHRAGEAARLKVKKRFTLERMLDDYETLYTSLWSERGALKRVKGKDPHEGMIQTEENSKTCAAL